LLALLLLIGKPIKGNSVANLREWASTA